MEFIIIQIIIFLSIIITSLISGKKGTLVAVGIWIVQTLAIYKTISYGYLQVIVLGASFQFGMMVGLIRDVIVKNLNEKEE